MKTVLFFTVLFLMSIPGNLTAQSDTSGVLNQYDRHWEMQLGIYRVLKNGLTGVVTTAGKEVIPVEFDQVWSPENNNYIRVLKNRKTGLYHLEQGIILPAEYDQIWPFSNGLAKVMKNRRFGFVNPQGLMLIPCEYQHIWDAKDNRIKVMKDGLTGFLETDGEILVPVIYQQIWEFNDGMARVLRDGKMGFIDESGNEIIPAIYDHIWSFENNKARALKDGWQVMLNRKGHLLYVLDDEPEKLELSPDGSESSDTTELYVYDGKKLTSRIRIGKDHIEIISRPEKEKPRGKTKSHKKPFLGHVSGAGLAMNSYLNSNGKEQLPAGYEFMELIQGKSLEVSLYPFQESIGLLGNWFGLTAGAGLQFNNYRFNLESPNDIPAVASHWFPDIHESASISKSKITTLYLNIPVMAELLISNQHYHRPFYISGGIIGGVKLQSHTKLVYHDNQGRHKRKKRDNLGIRSFRYGFVAQAGFNNFSVYGTYYPVSLFESNKGPELYPFSIGVKYGF